MFRPRERAFQQFKCPRPQCVKRNIEGSSSNNYCSAKAISIVYSECVFVALGVRHEMRMRNIVIFGRLGTTIFFSTLSHERRDYSKKTSFNIGCLF